ncbi:acyl-CoA thioesterase [Kitasatospora sp. NBC_01560]|uniref:acyl-CoA thioesterase n=1 Tax=Kitasatospora sp. NBC_01560 TaxID=2975965 RepID=UPI00386B3864
MTESPARVLPRPADTVEPFRTADRVHFDELDPMGILHNARYQIHVERAVSAFYRLHGLDTPPGELGGSDRFHAVRRFEIDFELPFREEGPLRVELWLDHLGRTSMRYGFACLGSADEVHATGARTVVRIDPVDFRPREWSTGWREAHLNGLRIERSF